MANNFVQQFGERIKGYLDLRTDEEEEQLRRDVLQYANANPAAFQHELNEVMFDEKLDPLSVVLEALSEDAENWGDFFVSTLGKIFDTAKKSATPENVFISLMDFFYIEEINAPFVQRIADRLHKETESDHLVSQFAAIWYLPPYLHNPSVRNRAMLTQALQQKLYDKNWKVRNVTFRSLKEEQLLPEGYKPSLADKLRKFFFGEPKKI